MRKKRKEFLITGHARSGTAYMANLFTKNGYEIGHERMKSDGISSWMFAVCAEQYPFTFDNSTRQQYSFKNIIHVIRNPIDAIASIVHTEYASEDFRTKYVQMFGNEYERAIMSYIGWNKLIHSQCPDITVRLEDAARHFKFEDVEIANRREHPVMTFEQLKEKITLNGLEYELEKFVDYYYSI